MEDDAFEVMAVKGAKILVADYDAEFTSLLEDALEGEEMEVAAATTGQQAIRLSYSFQPHLSVIADPLPDMSGFELCRLLRQLGDVCVVLMVPGSSDELVLQGYGCGADDCVTTPVSVAVLVARVQAVLQRGWPMSDRRQQDSVEQFVDDHLVIDLARRRVLVEGQHVHLTPTEFRLLSYLVRCAGNVLTYAEILDYVWELKERPRANYVHTYISRLRHKLEIDPHSPRYLLSEPRVGYRFR